MNEHTEDLIDVVYNALEGCEDLMKYHAAHGTPSLLILTQHSPVVAKASAELLAPWIDGKRVIEIGAGVGFLAIEMAKRAKSVVAIECDPAWSWVFTRSLYLHKPKNLTWIFGSADNMVGSIRGDVAVIFTNSGIKEMGELGKRFCPQVVMPMQEQFWTQRKFNIDPHGIALEHAEEIKKTWNLHGATN